MSATPKIDRAKLTQIVEDLERARQYRRTHQLEFFKPYPKQKQFFDLGRTKRERLFKAGNRVGKTEGGAVESTYHLTGLYPAWWDGARFDHPVRGWGAGVKSLDVRNIMQVKLCGAYGVESAFGTGYIPKDLFVDKPSLMRGVTDAYDTIQVKHFTNGSEDGISTFQFKSYEQGRVGFQGDEIHFGWGDEEPEKFEVYSEFLTRLAPDGIMYTTFTPLFGKTELTMRFDQPHPDRGLVMMSLHDALHFTKEEIAKRIEAMPKWQRATRAEGVEMAGEGRVFDIDPDFIKEARIQHIPAHWHKIWGIDFGIGHPFGAVLLLWDKDLDVIHVHHALRMQDDERLSLPLHHSLAMKPLGENVPVAWPQDGYARDKGTGDAVKDIYRRHGLKMLHEHAQWEDGGNSTEAGILEMTERMATGRLRVASHLSDWFEEFLSYHRKDGLIVKVRDDLMSATRIGIMHKRFSKPVILGAGAQTPRRQRMAEGVDFDVFNPRDDKMDIWTGEPNNPLEFYRR